MKYHSGVSAGSAAQKGLLKGYVISENIVRKDTQASKGKPQGGAFPGLANSQAPRPHQGPRFFPSSLTAILGLPAG